MNLFGVGTVSLCGEMENFWSKQTDLSVIRGHTKGLAGERGVNETLQ